MENFKKEEESRKKEEERVKTFHFLLEKRNFYSGCLVPFVIGRRRAIASPNY